MGRYYNGDIEGKFWFAVQSSDDASFFGGTQSDPSFIVFDFDKDSDMKSVEDGLKKCVKALGKYEKPLDKFFKKGQPYNDTQVAKALLIPEKEVKPLLVWYARLSLGRKIHKCLLENGYCNFEAEL